MKLLEDIWNECGGWIVLIGFLFVLFGPAFCGGTQYAGDTHRLDAQPEAERRVR